MVGVIKTVRHGSQWQWVIKTQAPDITVVCDTKFHQPYLARQNAMNVVKLFENGLHIWPEDERR